MSLRDAELSRSQRAARAHTKQQARKKKVRSVGVGHNLGPPIAPDLPPLPDDNEVLSFPAWCKLNNIGTRTGRRIRASGKGPIVTQLSDRRIGVTKRNNRIWQAQRAR
jgi:hypothetical protein